MNDGQKRDIEHLQQEIDHQEEQARYWERPEVFGGQNVMTGAIINKEEQVEKYRMRAQELSKLRDHALKVWGGSERN